MDLCVCVCVGGGGEESRQIAGIYRLSLGRPGDDRVYITVSNLVRYIIEQSYVYVHYQTTSQGTTSSKKHRVINKVCVCFRI